MTRGTGFKWVYHTLFSVPGQRTEEQTDKEMPGN